MSSPRVAIIDIGSNSIKVLVAERDAEGHVRELAAKTLDARISAGISREHPRLTTENMDRGVGAIRELLAVAAPYSPETITLVATSAVRDAENGAEFREHVRRETGQEIRILSGDEEATFIGHGLMCDRSLEGLRDFYVFDLGGGSLECLAFRNREIVRETSQRLGCVRLTERFVRAPESPLSADAATALRAHVDETVRAAFPFSLPAGAAAIATGGTMSTTRAILGAREGKRLPDTSPIVSVEALRALSVEINALDLAVRRTIPAMPAARADVFPAALLTFIALAELGGFQEYRHSLHNLRFGLAAEALGVICR